MNKNQSSVQESFSIPISPENEASLSRGVSINKNETSNNNVSKPSSSAADGRESCMSDTRSLTATYETASMTSKASRVSQFARRMSLRKSKAWLSAKFKKHQKNNDLSATFNLLDQENKGLLVDLNQATEEELMTVSGITRTVAKSIIEYRTVIGGFRNLQDLALVSGVGAAKLAQLSRDFTISENFDGGKTQQPSHETATPLLPTASPPLPTASPLPYSLQPPEMSLPSSQLSSPQSASPCSSVNPTAPPDVLLQATPRSTPFKKVHLNTATIFELMSVPGLNQEMAAQIVHHREKKGPFKTAEDVSKVRGLRTRSCRHILPHLTVDSPGTSCTPALTNGHSDDGRAAATAASAGMTIGNGGGRTPGDRRPQHRQMQRAMHPGHRRTLSAPTNNNNNNQASGNSKPMIVLPPTALNDAEVLKVIEQAADDSVSCSPRLVGHRLSLEFTSDVYELLSLRSERPEIHGLFENVHNGRRAVRVATWSLCQLTPDKLSNPGVMEVICRTVLERGFSLVAVQDILGAKLLPKICHELNTGSLRRVREWPGEIGDWACQVSPVPVSRYGSRRGTSAASNEYVGFLFNKKYIHLEEHWLLETTSRKHGLVSKPYLGRFRAHELTFTVVNLHGKLQSCIDRCESFLQTCDHFLRPFSGSSDNHSRNSIDSQDDLKSAKNLHNGYIKDRKDIAADEAGVIESETLNGSICNNNGNEAGNAIAAACNDTSVAADEGHTDGRVKRRLEFTRSGDAREQQLQDALIAVLRDLQESVLRDSAVILLGNIGAPPDSAGLKALQSLGYCSVQAADVCTVLCSSPATPLAADHIWTSPALTRHYYTGNSAVVREGLGHLAIPKGWGWGGLATSHCPLYADFYVDAAAARS